MISRTARAAPLVWLWVLPAAGLIFLIAWYPHSWPDRLATGKIVQAVFLAGTPTSHRAPGPGNGVEVSLPHRWEALSPALTEAWYEATLELEAPQEHLWAVFLPSLRTNAAVYVNDQLIGSGGDLDDQIERRWNHPLYFLLPASLLRPGTNSIHVRLLSDTPGKGMLAPFHVGPDQVLRPAYVLMRFFRVTLAEIITSFSATVSAFMAVLWLRRRRETIYGWFALAIAVWTVHDLNLILVKPPVATVAWDWLWMSSVGFFVILVVVFIHRFLGHVRPKLERALFGIGLVGSSGLAVLGATAPQAMHFYGTHVWDGAVTALGLYPAAMMINASHRRLGTEGHVLLLSGLLILAFGAHDWMALAGLLHCHNGMLMHLSAPVVIGAFAWILLKRFVSALEESESLNRELEERVAERTAEIAHTYDQIERLERREVLSRERERIMVDIHDGVGGQLVSLLSLAESGRGSRPEICDGLRTALDELRLTIDSLDPDYTDLGAALNFLRQRLVPRLGAAGLKVTWPTDTPGAERTSLKPGQLVQLVRVLQEALTNVLKHAGATQVEVEVRAEPTEAGSDRLVLQVTDDGRGFGQEVREGRGLPGMRKRAQTLGGELHIESTSAGTRVRLRLPADY
jgi:signal transduction histidine kinase